MNNSREHILNVAFKLFMQKSFKEVTMKEIVDKTGMSKGAFYHYFESKEQVFLELINNAFSSLNGYYSSFTTDSLYRFYHDYVDNFIKNLFPESRGEDGESFSFNYFSLIFDALKLFPSFQGKLIEAQESELNLWKDIIHNAKEKKEIRSSMDNEQIARMFISSSDGVGMRSILIKSGSKDTKKTLLALWDSFYEMLKA